MLRKLGHVAGYLVLTLLLLRALRRSGVAGAVPVAMAAAFAYAVSDEWHQSFVPGRERDPERRRDRRDRHRARGARGHAHARARARGMTGRSSSPSA